jgi:hypothetical protein
MGSSASRYRPHGTFLPQQAMRGDRIAYRRFAPALN